MYRDFDTIQVTETPSERVRDWHYWASLGHSSFPPQAVSGLGKVRKSRIKGAAKTDFIKPIKIGLLGLMALNDNFGQLTANCWYLAFEWPFTHFTHTYSSQQSRRLFTWPRFIDEEREAQWDEVTQIKSFGKWKKREISSLLLQTSSVFVGFF